MECSEIKNSELEWTKVVWGRHNVPKMASCALLAKLNRVNTKERILDGITQSILHVFFVINTWRLETTYSSIAGTLNKSGMTSNLKYI